MNNKIKVPVCPICGEEEYCYSVCIKCDSRPRLKLIEREKKTLLSGNYRVKDYISTKTNAEIILVNIDTNEEYNVSLNHFFKMIKGLEYHYLVLQERKQGSAYSWEIIDLLEEE
jgi:hypothetical protein